MFYFGQSFEFISRPRLGRHHGTSATNGAPILANGVHGEVASEAAVVALKRDIIIDNFI